MSAADSAPAVTTRPAFRTGPPRPGRSVGPAAGWIHSIETGGAADGPGIRYVLFLAGCPLRCLYCHNPDSWHARDGHLMTAAELLEDIARYRSFLSHGHGGVTFSGGEPLFQPEFLATLLRGCQELGLHTAIDTSGFHGARASDALLADTDLVLLDIKAYSPARYHRLTSAKLEPTLAFARRLAALGKPVWLRYVLVPGYTDQLDEIAGLAQFAAGLGNVARVDVLPFHQLGAAKWQALGLDYQLAAVAPPGEPLLQSVRAIFSAAGLATH